MSTASVAARSSRFAPITLGRFVLDPVIFTVAGLLLLLGLLMVASSSIASAGRSLGDPLFIFYRQLVYAIGGIGLAIICMRIPMSFWERTSQLWLLAALALLTLVLLPGVGHEVNGSTRWIPLGPVNLQVSEPARLFMLVFVAGYLVRHGQALRDSFAGFIRPVFFVLVACTLLLLEPDFGAATVLFAVAVGLLFMGGMRISHFMLIVGAGVIALGLLAVTSPYRLERLTGFLDPWADPFDSGFQLTQSLIAIGRGEWIGVGLGASVQKLFYLPEAHTDFVFAVLAEELGLIGSLSVIVLYVLLVWRAFWISRMASRSLRFFHAYLAAGIGLWLGLQAFVNIGVNMGVLPTKGLTLPMLSYGGSSLLTTCASIGMLLRIRHEMFGLEAKLKRRR